jgi:hypothetical protein
VRLVKIGADGEGRFADIMKISRPDDLDDIANLGLTVADGKQVLAGLQQEIVAAQARSQSVRGPSQVWGSGGNRALRVCIVGWVKFLSVAGTECTIVDRAANLEQESAPRRDQRICCDLFIRRFTRKLAVPSVIAVPPLKPARWRSA